MHGAENRNDRGPRSERTEPSGPESTGRDLTHSGYRMGSPKAQGPDPYARFDGEEDQASNVRHFPTRDRELGDDLKLSGLLGRSGGDDPESSEPKKSRDESSDESDRDELDS